MRQTIPSIVIKYSRRTLSKRVLKNGQALEMEHLSAVAPGTGQPERVARLLGARSGFRDSIQTPRPDYWMGHYDEWESESCELLGDKCYIVLWQEGHSMSSEEAIAFAIEDRESPKG